MRAALTALAAVTVLILVAGQGAAAPTAPPPTPEPCSALSGADERARCEADERAAKGNQPAPRTRRDVVDTLGGGWDCNSRGLIPRDPNTNPLYRNCLGSGSPAHEFPLQHYLFDTRIDTTGRDMPNVVWVAAQIPLQILWLAVLFVFRVILSVLDLVMRIDILPSRSGEIGEQLTLLRDRIGAPWLGAALAALGLWTMWRGIIQRRTTATLAGVGGSVLAMVLCGVIIAAPAETVGYGSQLASEATKETLGVATDGATGDMAVAATQRRLFDSVVMGPFCAMNFADVDFCLRRTDLPDLDGDLRKGAGSVAEMYLQYPANGGERDDIYASWKNRRSLDGKPSEEMERVQMQRRDATITRWGMFGLILIGWVGALLLFGTIAARLLGHTVMVLVLTLLAPVMLLVAALGESGRASFVTWGKHLLVSLLAKLFYAFFFAVALLGGAVIQRLFAPGQWYFTWLLMAAFWWTLLLRREMLVGFFTAGATSDSSHGLMRGLAAAYAATRLTRIAGGVFSRPVAAVGHGMTERIGRASDARQEGARAAGQARLGQEADAALTERLAGDEQTVRRADIGETELRAVDSALNRIQSSRLLGQPIPLPEGREEELLARREGLLAESRAPHVQEARARVRQSADNRARHGEPFSPEQRNAQIAAMRRLEATPGGFEIDEAGPSSDQLRAAGFDPRDPADRRRAEVVRQRLSVQRELVRSVSEDERVRTDVERVRRVVGDEDFSRAVLLEKGAMDEERRAERRARRMGMRFARARR